MTILQFFFILCFSCASFGLQCMDENNKPVDWYILYKIPHIKKNAPNQLIKNGFGYLFISPENTKTWTLSEKSIMDGTDSFLARTLNPLYQNSENASIVHIFYNDERPSGNNKNTKGHTKGAVAADADGGFWLIHSVPTYPPELNEQYFYPLSGTVYGQSFLCLSLNAANINNVGTQLMYNQPQIYSSNISYDLIIKYPNLKKVIDREGPTGEPWYHVQIMETLAGESFVSFAKARQFAEELYEDLVAPMLKSSLEVETWLNGPGKLPSNCSNRFSVNNVQEINLKEAQVSFTSALDHSKWAVSTEANENWTCIGDINRAEHQKSRGGGTTCINQVNIANLYKQAIATIESCPRTSNHIPE